MPNVNTFGALFIILIIANIAVTDVAVQIIQKPSDSDALLNGSSFENYWILPIYQKLKSIFCLNFLNIPTAGLVRIIARLNKQRRPFAQKGKCMLGHFWKNLSEIRILSWFRLFQFDCISLVTTIQFHFVPSLISFYRPNSTIYTAVFLDSSRWENH